MWAGWPRKSTLEADATELLKLGPVCGFSSLLLLDPPQLSWTSEVAPCVQLEGPGLSQQGTKWGAPHSQAPSWGNATADNGGRTMPPLEHDAHHREHPLSLCPLIHATTAPPWSSCPNSHLAAQGSHGCTARAMRRILPKPPHLPVRAPTPVTTGRPLQPHDSPEGTRSWSLCSSEFHQHKSRAFEGWKWEHMMHLS